jgi:Cd2+/Zn2+-exporting ATPase
LSDKNAVGSTELVPSVGRHEHVHPHARKSHAHNETAAGQHNHGHVHDPEKEWKVQLMAAVLCGCFAIGGAKTTGSISLVLFIISYASGAFYLVGDVWERLREKVLDIHFLMLVVAIGSASIGGWGEGATLLFLFSLSSALEHYAEGRTQREIRSLYKNAPKTAILIDPSGLEKTIAVEDLALGMVLLIKPGEQFPVDAEIVFGQTAADESSLTGESIPVEKGIGDSVFAGTINSWGAVRVQVTKSVQESALRKIIRLIEQAQHMKAPAQRFTDRFGTSYTYLVLALSTGMFFAWWLWWKLPPFHAAAGSKSAFYLAMTLLVVSSPCALVLSIPSAVLAAIAWAARHGILFRGGIAVQNLAGISVVAMDKTGTLTTGELRVDKVESFPPGNENKIAQLAFSLERLSTHPLARAITKYGKQKSLPALGMSNFESVTGCGLRARTPEGEVYLGKRSWVIAADCRATLPEEAQLGMGFSEVWLSNGELIGRIVLRDEVRAEAAGLIKHLRGIGLHTIVLTGDRRSAAEHLKQKLQVDEIRAELTPEQKVNIIQHFSNVGRCVAMIGDGVNDAPSLAAANVGVAMGARGSDAALEQADVVLMHDKLESFLSAYALSKRARRVIFQNVAISLGTVVVLMVFALFGAIPLTVGVVGHEGSTVLVVLNSLRLLLRERHDHA